MIGSTIAKRYARAFFEIAEEERRLEEYYNELNGFLSIVEGNEDLKGFLANPVFDQAEKKAVVESILKKINISGITANFIKLLTDKRRIVILRDIVECYREMMDEALHTVRVNVKTAFPLSDELKAQLQSGLEAQTGKRVQMTVTEDPSLLAGIVVRVGDTLYDNSIRTQLNNIRNLLGEER
ncbi:MAG TPA: ATP synthase F1 subunit delta [Syntrophales bacterium]|mgnify:CR=1 FL=1|nr:ATP synthase F1 subunit delta [Syntrophales bacterium]HOM07120.1 ATP synthase F1 subunit delta [Syntrophales bacterium]HOO00365.1 ATP synthase F1 subunit delta [Syntrophales bacterium]HPC00436.1 ATP synthase F1 subunit delta [Syntrophales bacterium]HPQ05519.1 ATP synthase F1 subunit delta [Syntrophales bacterium]